MLHVHICRYLYMYVHMCILSYILAHIHAYALDAFMHLHECIRACIHARTHTHTHPHTHTPTQVLDYLSDFICVLYGKPGGYGVVTMPFSVREGINIFLAGFIPTENLRFREIELSFKISENPEDLAGIHSASTAPPTSFMLLPHPSCFWYTLPWQSCIHVRFTHDMSACDILACGIRADEFRSRVSWYRILACGMRAHAPTRRASFRRCFYRPRGTY